jgi:hypothetical protein
MTAEPPDLSSLLGKTKKQWDALMGFLAERQGIVPEWKFYGEKHGWQVKLTTKKRALAYLIPRQGHFTAALALRRQAIAALRENGLPELLVRSIESAKESSEGKPARLEITGPDELALLKKLLEVKLKAT